MQNNPVKQQQIDDFISYTCTSRQIAQRFLINAKWNLAQAINLFYDQGAPMPQPEKVNEISEVENFFKSNCVTENQTEILGQEGLQKLFSSVLKIDMSNIVIGHIMINVMQMKKAGQATKENLYNLFKSTNSRSFSEVAKNIGKLEKEIRERKDLFRNMYMGFFQFYSVTKVPTLDFEIAEQIWQTYLKNVMPYYSHFMEYLKQLKNKPFKVHKDLWKMTYQFATTIKNVSDHSENDGWPLLIDDFVTYLKQKGIK